MFNAFFAEETGQKVPDQDEQASTSSGQPGASAAANPLLGLWSVATAVTSSVKARADELVKSVVDTDWRSELSTFGREVGEESKTLKEKTAELVEHLPDQVVHLPEKAEEALHHLPAQVHLPKDVGQTLEGVGSAFAQLGKTLLMGTKELLDELKDGVETEIAAATKEGKRAGRAKPSASSAAKLQSVQAKYSRFEAEVAAMQRDSSTYCDEPEDAEEYARWRSGFSLAGAGGEIGRITAENAFMAELQSRLVPIIVEHEDFWSRYFYRLHKLQQKEEQRQQLAQRAKSLQEDDVPLGWGDEDEAPATPGPSGVGASAGDAKELAGPSSSLSPKAPATQQAEAPAVAESQPAARAAELAGSGSGAAEAPSVSSTPGTPAAPASEQQPLSSPAGGAGTTSAAASAPDAGAASVAAAEAAAAEPTAPSPSQTSRVEGRLASVGGASVGSSTMEHVDAESGAEPHAETASDSSGREWCVVSSDGKAAAPGGSGAAASSAAEPATSPRVLPVSSSGGAAEAEPEAAGASPAAAGAAAPASGRDAGSPSPSEPASTTSGQEAAASSPAGAKPAAAASASAPAPPKAGDDEEVDEDWGNWD